MKITNHTKLVLLLLVCTQSFQSWGQHTNSGSNLSSEIFLFIEGEGINSAYLRKELPFVTFVREPQLSNVHILITSVDNASGGEHYRFEFMGKKAFSGKHFELMHTSRQHETEIEEREELVKVIKMGLMPFLSQTTAKNNIDFQYNKQVTLQEEFNGDEDPWNFWVFGIGGDVWYEEEETQKEYMLQASADFDRVTEEWRIRNDVDYQFRLRQFTDDDKIIQSSNEEADWNSSVVKSLTGRWSAGIFLGFESSNFTNLKRSFQASSAIEYNLFPWEELDRREFTIAYHTGYRRNNYFEETIYGKKMENLFYEALQINFEMIKPWGEVETRVSGSHYFHNIKFNNLEIDSEISFRLTKFLFFDIEAGFEMIHDQLYLQKGDASLEDILLEQRKLETTYEFEFEIGLDFRFGSIYNNVINNRL